MFALETHLIGTSSIMLTPLEAKPKLLARSQSTNLPHERIDSHSYRRSQSYSPQMIRREMSDQTDVECLLESIDCTSYSLIHSKNYSWLCIGVLLFACVSGYVAREAIQSTAATVSSMEENRLLLRQKITSVSNDLVHLKKQINSIDMMSETDYNLDKEELKVSNIRAMYQMNTAQKRVDKASKQALILKQKLQSLSLARISQDYGDGAHFVEFELEFQDGQDGPNKFVIELAPSDLMPHSVETFLNMVSNKLIDGCSFIMHALNLIKAAPIPYDGSSAREKAQSFADHGLDKLAFKEYHPNFPHKKYTVGFTADGSPSFFINVDDNSHSHEGDPCFGTVVQGFDTIKRLESSPTRNGIWFTQRVGIKSAEIVDINSISYEPIMLRHNSRA